jgi:hypothetical protein
MAVTTFGSVQVPATGTVLRLRRFVGIAPVSATGFATDPFPLSGDVTETVDPLTDATEAQVPPKM